MSNPLANLFGQGGPLAPSEIVVNGQNGPQGVSNPVDVYSDFILGNSQAIQERDAAAQNSEEAAQHKGMFGIKGTLRDVLGTLGDAMLVQSGNNRVYAPAREQERMGDAMSGFTRDPSAAAERVSAYDPQIAQQLMARAAAEQQARQQAAMAQQKAQLEAIKSGNETYDNYAEMFSKAAGAVTPDTVQYLAPIMSKLKERGNLGDDYLIPETGDEPFLRGYQRMSIDSKDQITRDQQDRRLSQYDRGLGISQQNADSSRIRANRPPARSSGRSQTTLEYYKEIDRKPASQRSAGEQAFYEKYQSSGGSRSTNRRDLSGPRPNLRVLGRE